MTINMTKTRGTIRKVIEDYGSTITITPMTIALDKWGDKTETTGTPVSTVGVSYDYFTARFNFQPAGNLTEGDVIIIIKDDETITTQSGSTTYKVTYNSVVYNIISVEDYKVADTILAKQIILKKRI